MARTDVRASRVSELNSRFNTPGYAVTGADDLDAIYTAASDGRLTFYRVLASTLNRPTDIETGMCITYRNSVNWGAQLIIADSGAAFRMKRSGTFGDWINFIVPTNLSITVNSDAGVVKAEDNSFRLGSLVVYTCKFRAVTVAAGSSIVLGTVPVNVNSELSVFTEVAGKPDIMSWIRAATKEIVLATNAETELSNVEVRILCVFSVNPKG